MRKFLLIISVVIGIFFLLKYNNDSIGKENQNIIFTDINSTPNKKVGLLLGTSKYLANHNLNYFYTYRIQATAQLYKAGKIKGVLISGDNSEENYNEPETMRDDLILAGIPSQFITLDYAGFSTLDSLIRANAIFGIDDYIIISQQFHVERALYIAKKKGFKAIGFAVKDIKGTSGAYRMLVREFGARAKAIIDVYFDTKAHFYGDKIEVKVNTDTNTTNITSR